MEDTIFIRPMTIEDYEGVRHLWEKISGFGIRSVDDSRESVERFINRNPETSVVAVRGEKIIGSILCGNDGRQGMLYHVCVHKKYRRNGIGRQMVGHCMKILSEQGINKVALVAYTNNDSGNAFWNGLGWRKRDDFNYYDFILNEKNIIRFIGESAEVEEEEE